MVRTNPIRTFSYHYRNKFGHVVGKVPLDAGVICPNRANGGCIFCRPKSFTPSCLEGSDELEVQVDRGKRYLLKGRFRKYFAYFQQETCTVLPVQRLLDIVKILLADPDCVGLIISTRPDCVENELLSPLAKLIKTCGKDCLFELGVQTVHHRSLKLLNRNHTYEDFLESGAAIKSYNCFELSAHLIFGIPGESYGDMVLSLQRVCDFGVHALKLHHLQVIRDTPLENLFRKGGVELFSLKGYISFLIEILPLIPPEVALHRLWATAHPQLLVAPKWNILTSELSRFLLKELENQNVWQGKSCVAAADAVE